jgi:lipopolysaccharide transport system permease protein
VYPLPTQGLLATLTAYNPLTSPLMCAREYVVQGWSAYTVSMMVTFLVALVLLLAAWVLFRLALPIIVERIGT